MDLKMLGLIEKRLQQMQKESLTIKKIQQTLLLEEISVRMGTGEEQHRVLRLIGRAFDAMIEKGVGEKTMWNMPNVMSILEEIHRFGKPQNIFFFDFWSNGERLSLEQRRVMREVIPHIQTNLEGGELLLSSDAGASNSRLRI